MGHARGVGRGTAAGVRSGSLAAAAYWAAVAALMLPLGLIALTSLTNATLVGFPLGRPSLRWYAAVLADPANGHAFLLSVVLAAASAAMAAVVGTWIALAARMMRPGWRLLLLAATLVPLVTPGIVHAIGLRIAIRFVGLDPGPLAILFGHSVHATPLAAIMIGARLATTPPGLLDAARDLGAGPVRAFLHVQLPWLRPAAAGAAVLSALNSFDDFVRSFFLGGYEPTLPVLIFGRLRAGLTPEINALATLILVASVGAAAIVAWMARPRGRPGTAQGSLRKPSMID
jgi:spermidine/putrescine transport system permease protein